MTLHTGRLPYVHDSRDLLLEKYVKPSATRTRVPWNLGHADKMPTPRLMLGNGPDDSVAPGFGGAGDCVFAFIANAIRLACAIGGKSQPPITGKEAIAAYSEVTGYKLNDPSTDNGTNMRDALKWWQDPGFADADGVRHKLGAYLLIKGGHDAWFQALYQLDVGVGLGMAWPNSAMDQFRAGKVLTHVPGSPSDSGHATLLDARAQWPKFECWAEDKNVSAPFLINQVEEAWAILMPEMLVDNKSPEGLDISQLNADLAALGK